MQEDVTMGRTVREDKMLRRRLDSSQSALEAWRPSDEIVQAGD
jgi:hypothetical protein